MLSLTPFCASRHRTAYKGRTRHGDSWRIRGLCSPRVHGRSGPLFPIDRWDAERSRSDGGSQLRYRTGASTLINLVTREGGLSWVVTNPETAPGVARASCRRAGAVPRKYSAHQTISGASGPPSVAGLTNGFLPARSRSQICSECQRRRDIAAAGRSKSAARTQARRPPISGAFLLCSLFLRGLVRGQLRFGAA